MTTFIGRQAEISQLIEFKEKKTASFILLRGRRRIGKSRLVKELGKHFEHFYTFSGLPPDRSVDNIHQINEFSKQLSRQFNAPAARYDDWSDIFWALAERLRVGSTLLLFDEISWMGSRDPTFLGKIKNLWDLHLKENNKLLFVICGSASSWIDKNILSSTGFVGRISLTLTLDELPLKDCSQFWPQNISNYEKFKVLAVIGGVPKYLEEINPKQSAEENIKKLCFTKGGFLVDEFNQIFSDIFLRKSTLYLEILNALADGPKEHNAICEAIHRERHGRISEYLKELELSGYIQRDFTWNVKTVIDSGLSQYRLSDNYVRFYLKYIDKNLSKINRQNFVAKSLTALPEWSTLMGLQFENLVLNNRKFIHSKLRIQPEDILCDNPFFQRKTNRMPGCQIDYMIQTKFNTLYICEIKFSKDKIGLSVIDSIRSKMNAIKYPKGISCRPVLIHVNGVTDDLLESDFFSAIIDMGEALA
ncbi:MAG: ATP-binding protein [Gammaproteobacteria bacterium]